MSLFQISTRVLFHHGLSHNSLLELASESRKFHDALGLSLDHASNETTKAAAAGLTLEKHYDQPLPSVYGKDSRISFVNSMSQEETTLNPPLELSCGIWENLYKIGKQLKESSTSFVQILAHLDLVYPTTIGVDVAYSTNSFRRKYDILLRPTNAISPSNFLAPIGSVDEYSQTDNHPLYAFQQLLIATRNVLSPHSGLGIKLAFEENGAIILVPNTAMIGDILCHFADTDTLAILRPSQETKNKYHLVGRAVFYTRHSSLGGM